MGLVMVTKSGQVDAPDPGLWVFYVMNLLLNPKLVITSSTLGFSLVCEFIFYVTYMNQTLGFPRASGILSPHTVKNEPKLLPLQTHRAKMLVPSTSSSLDCSSSPGTWPPHLPRR